MFKQYYIALLCLVFFLISAWLYYAFSLPPKKTITETLWIAPDLSTIPKEDTLIRYGRELIANTAKYFGPKGSIAQISNGMNCQNCHLDAGTRLNANCFALVASEYPKYRDRSGKIESVEFRVNECMERSMNGHSIDTASKEMLAMVAYLKWVGKDVHKGIDPPKGTAFKALSYMDHTADPAKGRLIYLTQCVSCHGTNGEGSVKSDSSGYYYPPLWGAHSYNVSAGLYRISKLATFVKNNMPYKNYSTNPELTDEEAWNVSAYILSQPRPLIFFKYDWPKISTKPIDYPFGPYTDNFSEQQHKYGPFWEMKKAK